MKEADGWVLIEKLNKLVEDCADAAKGEKSPESVHRFSESARNFASAAESIFYILENDDERSEELARLVNASKEEEA